MPISNVFNAVVEQKGERKLNELDAQTLIEAAKNENHQSETDKTIGTQALNALLDQHKDRFEIGAKARVAGWVEMNGKPKAPVIDVG
ncbi:MAG: hypothetical protein V4534_07045 [Myxococcota bacterium]